jgi:hypothetical protein
MSRMPGAKKKLANPETSGLASLLNIAKAIKE